VWSSRFRAETAPALVELDVADTISSATLRQLKRFIETHVTSAIGIAGPRGAGKTTLMEQLCYDRDLNSLNVRVSAPVYYDAHQLVRLIHTRLARSMLSPRQLDRLRPTVLPRIRQLLWQLAKVAAVVICLAVLVSLWLWEQDNYTSLPFHVGALSLLAICGLSFAALVLAFIAWRTLRRRSEALAEPSTVSELARQQLELLRWSVDTQQTAKAGIDLERLTAERETQVTRHERVLTHAESVDLLRDFLLDLARLSARPVVLVCIDELDKMSDPNKAVEMINGIKDLFHIPGVHFVVSVSTDALHRFAARGVPVRDVFDSSFDTIVNMRRLSAKESRLVISRRATDFCTPAVLFCHAWSGGHARDLIRTARACVDVRADSGTDVDLADLVEAVLRQDVSEVIDAAIEKLIGGQSAPKFDQLMALREAMAHPDPFNTAAAELLDLRKAMAQDPFSAAAAESPDESEALANALHPYLRLAEATRTFFGTPRSPEEWKDVATEAMVEQLAAIRCVLAPRPYEAIRLLERMYVPATVP
jgi:hypothetical protein